MSGADPIETRPGGSKSRALKHFDAKVAASAWCAGSDPAKCRRRVDGDKRIDPALISFEPPFFGPSNTYRIPPWIISLFA